MMLTRRQFLISCAGTIAGISGLSAVLQYKKISKSIPILLYHRVGSEVDDYTVTITRFEQDMQTLHGEGFTALSLEQINNYLQRPDWSLPDKPLIITFDDGYLDNYTNVFPILQKYSMTASFYIITGMVGLDDRLTISQIREMEAAGMEFGSHTVSHRLLAELTYKEIEFELTKSKYDLEQILGKSVDFLAYPGGSYNPDTLKIASQAGYMGGLTTHYGLETFNHVFEIKRIPIFHYDRSLSYVMLKKGLLPSLIN
jgi:peptidoglycan/xylan/chitin deacetylase (PgdA/CDA1 family)